jgi:hypothetical protein
MKGLLTTALMAATLASAPAHAACWTAEEISAAKVRDMDTMLMVSALRCRNSGHDLLGSYNAFVRSGRGALTAANDSLRAHFEHAGGLNAYDRYVTAIANHYGAGAEGLSCRDMGSILSAARAEGNSLKGLERVADAADVSPSLSGGRCSTRMAAAR